MRDSLVSESYVKGMWKACTFGRSKDRGLNRVPLEGPPTYYPSQQLPCVLSSVKLTRMTAFVDA
jgi:hypothetical protein